MTTEAPQLDRDDKAQTLFVGYPGGNVNLYGASGYVTDFHTEGPHVVGAFIKCPVWEGSGPMLYARLGRTTDEKREYREIISLREINRDEFDLLNELDSLRRDLGWR